MPFIFIFPMMSLPTTGFSKFIAQRLRSSTVVKRLVATYS